MGRGGCDHYFCLIRRIDCKVTVYFSFQLRSLGRRLGIVVLCRRGPSFFFSAGLRAEDRVSRRVRAGMQPFQRPSIRFGMEELLLGCVYAMPVCRRPVIMLAPRASSTGHTRRDGGRSLVLPLLVDRPLFNAASAISWCGRRAPSAPRVLIETRWQGTAASRSRRTTWRSSSSCERGSARSMGLTCALVRPSLAGHGAVGCADGGAGVGSAGELWM